MMTHKKMHMLIAIVALAVCQMLAVGAAAADGTVHKLVLGDYYTEAHPFYSWVETFAKDVEKASNGRLVIEIHHAAQLGHEQELVNSLSLGSIDMAIGVGPGAMGLLYPPMQVFDAPFALINKDHIDNVSKSDWGKKMFDGLSEATNIRLLSFLYQGTRYITTSKIAIKSPVDLKGLKIRTPDQKLSIANFTAFGATPTPMAFGEVYLALQQGVVEGQENPLSQIIAAKFYEVQKHISLTGHVVQSTSMSINQASLDALPEDLRRILVDTAYKGQFEANALMLQFEQKQLKILESYNMVITKPDVDAFKKLSKKVIIENESLWGKGLYEQLAELL